MTSAEAKFKQNAVETQWSIVLQISILTKLEVGILEKKKTSFHKNCIGYRKVAFFLVLSVNYNTFVKEELTPLGSDISAGTNNKA